MLQYLKDTLFDIHNDTRHGPNLGHVVSKLAEYFGVETDEPPISAKPISRKDLWHAGYLINPYTPKPVTKRASYKAYCEEMGIPFPDDESQPEASMSAGPANENPNDEDEDELDANRHPTHETIQSPPLIDAHMGASSQSAALAWFSEYEARNEARWTTFTQLHARPVLAPRYIDWEYFNDELKIGDDILRYIRLLDLEEFEDTKAYAYQYLTLEFFSRVAKHENGKYLTAPLKGTEYKITDKVLCDIYNFDPSIESRHSPMGFKVDPHWAFIFPCETYKKSGPSSGQISDLAHLVIHKYISQMIFGKKESNKDTLFDIRNDTRRGPNMSHVVSKLAEYFGVETDEPPIRAKTISRKDLWHADYLINPHTPKPVTKQASYKTYCEKMGIPFPDDESQPEAGTSDGPADENPNDEDEDELDANRHPTHETIQPPPLINAHTGASSQSAAPVWFFKYEARDAHNACWTSFVESNDARWTEQTKRKERSGWRKSTLLNSITQRAVRPKDLRWLF
ncbi:inosine-5'-monophosphate dehydrogenase [Striga asiatica]|uniref:Inosine-5'-monophosphate dehydrogenase n=1 Tax=Striga asiatica TaxID=4170 RepID=A0A5A7Q9U1_STRAF|nr:inosine-5'-monophosphate dehydrogenase [Striga asiatica]